MTFLAAALMGGLFIAYHTLPSGLLQEGGIFLWPIRDLRGLPAPLDPHGCALDELARNPLIPRTRVVKRAQAIVTCAVSVVKFAFEDSLWILLFVPA